MAQNFPLSTLGPTINDAGISVPSYADILQSLMASFQSIYGADAYISADSQDGQMLALFASAISDANNAAVYLWNSFSPAVAQGTELSSLVKINGIRRQTASFSAAVGSVVGQVGTIINNGSVQDINGNLWNLPASVTIPGAGTIDVTVTAQEPGIIVAPAGTINKINSPSFGWQSFTSTTDATPGTPIESDAALRVRQATATSLPAQTPLASLQGAISNLDGVTRVQVYENATALVDANGLPPHSISAVVGGGTLQDIVNTIGAKKTPGAGTFGSVSGTYTDPITGITYTINYYTQGLSTVKTNMTIKVGNGYSSVVHDEIVAAVVAYVNALTIGTDVQYTRMIPVAYLNGAADGSTYEILSLTIALDAGPFGTVDLAVPFNKAASCGAPNVTIVET